MKMNLGRKWEESKVIITSVCGILDLSRRTTPAFVLPPQPPVADCQVLLHDATRLFCQAVSEYYGEPGNPRWSQELPEFLLMHPERCQETLARLEEQEYCEPGLVPVGS